MNDPMSDGARILRVALVGCGRISAYHVEALKALPGVEIVGVCDANNDAARACATLHGIRGCYTDIETMARELRPDVVHLLTPPSSHLALARIALQYGAHLYVEKPFAANEAEARQILQLAREAGVRVCPGHSRLFDPVFVEACRRVRVGEIGRVISVRAEQGFTYEAAARSSRIPWSYTYDWGLFDNLICHPLYLACHFLKNPGPPQVVGFNPGKVREAGVEEIRILVPSDTGVGEVSLSLSTAPEVNRVELVGTQGRIVADWQTMSVLTRRKTALPSAISRLTGNFAAATDLTRAGIQTLVGIATGRVKRYQGLRTIIELFYQSLHDGTEPPVLPEQGVLNLQLMDRIKGRCADVQKQRPESSRVSLHPRILVTGGSGFLGGRLLQTLSARDLPARATTRLRSRTEDIPGVQWLECDLSRTEDLRSALCDVDTVFHCAALCGAPGSLSDYQTVNVDGTMRLLRLAGECGVRNFIYVSSMSVYATPANPDTVLDENAALEPRAEERGAYTQTKLAAERAVLEYAREHRYPRVVVLRPGTIYGPGARLPVGRFQLPSPETRPLVAGGKAVPAGLVYVDDVVEAMLAAARSGVPSGSVYNITDTSNCDQEELARTLSQVSGGRIRPLFAPYPLVWTAMFGVDLLSLVRHRKLGTARYRFRRTLAPMRFECAAARKDLGWQPRVPLAVGLARSVERESQTPVGA
jgi:nucleoside-diphosphate-sugar epimerase/predicted dehydrogenase